MNLITLKDLKQGQAMIPVMVRLPPEIVEQADEVAREWQAKDASVTVTDVYRTAILFFFSNLSTISRDALTVESVHPTPITE